MYEIPTKKIIKMEMEMTDEQLSENDGEQNEIIKNIHSSTVSIIDSSLIKR